MPINRNALIRYKTIDKCLMNRQRKWTLDDLIDACSDALYDFAGIDDGVSKRTIQGDIQYMRSDAGYRAPIVVVSRKYYTYDDPAFSITDIPLNEEDVANLSEAIDLLRQFKGFKLLGELNGIVERLEDRIYVAKSNRPAIIYLDKNENLRGLHFIDTLYHAILQRQVVELTYQSFKARQSSTFLFHGAILREYNNRWFLLGQKKENAPILTLALDRIQSIKVKPSEPYIHHAFDAEDYFHDVVGVTVDHSRPQVVELLFDRAQAPYVLTKPLHHSQSIIDHSSEGLHIQLVVKLNFELERLILGFGSGVRVLSPKRLVNRIAKNVRNAADLYVAHD